MPRIPLTWLAEHVELPADATAEDLAAALVRVGLEEEALHGGDRVRSAGRRRVLSVEPEPQKNGKTINWCRVDVGPEPTSPGGEPAGHRLRRAQLRRRRPRRRAPAGCGAARAVRDRGAQDVRPRVRRHDLLQRRARPGRRPRRDHRAGRAARRRGRGRPRARDDAIALLGLADEVLEINVTPDRGYCFSMRGVAREYALSTGRGFTDPAARPSGRRAPPAAASPSSSTTPRRSTGGPGCDRFVARVVRGVRRRPRRRPRWMQRGCSRPACGRSAWPSTSPTT